MIIVAVVTGILMFGATSGWWSKLDTMPDRRPAGYALTLVALPILGLILLGAATAAAQQTRTKRAFAWRLIIVLVPTVATFGLLGVLVWLNERLARLAPGAMPPPWDWYGMLAPHVGWFIIVLMTAILGARATRRQSRLIWEAQPSLMRIKDFDITSTGVHIDEGVSERTYQWPALVRFIETQNLLLLCPSELMFEILPKRSFASPDDLQTAQSLFHAQIVARGTTPPAFPVLPVKQT